MKCILYWYVRYVEKYRLTSVLRIQGIACQSFVWKGFRPLSESNKKFKTHMVVALRFIHEKYVIVYININLWILLLYWFSNITFWTPFSVFVCKGFRTFPLSLCIGYTWIWIPISRLFGTFLEEFWLIFCRFWQIFCQKILETLAFVIFSINNLHFADFKLFFAKFRHIFGKK